MLPPRNPLRMRHLPLRKTIAAVAAGLALASIARAQANVAVDATTTVRIVDDRMFGLNTAVWDNSYADSQTLTALKAVDARFLRYPGGSSSDDFDWTDSMA